MSENQSVETGVPPKTGNGSQGATLKPDSKYTECGEIVITCYLKKKT